MHAADTNVIIRYLLGDDPAQAAKARALIEQNTVFVPRTVLLEAEWVLRSVYGLADAQAIAALRAFAGLPSVTVEDAALVERAMGWAGRGMDFADALHLAAAGECEGFATFDRKLIRAASGLSAIPVAAP